MSDEPIEPQLPFEDKNLMSCKECHAVLTQGQYFKDGCRVCDSGPVQRDEILETASPKFSGYVGLIDSNNSWVARLIGRQGVPSAVYAANVEDDDSEDEDREDDEYEKESAADPFAHAEVNDKYDDDDDDEPAVAANGEDDDLFQNILAPIQDGRAKREEEKRASSQPADVEGEVAPVQKELDVDDLEALLGA